MKTKILVEGRHGHGAIKKRLDLRDNKWKDIGKSSSPFDWSVGFNPSSTYPTKDQGASDSCGGQSGAYLNQVLTGSAEQSAKSIYSFIYYKGGGTTMRDIFNTICNRGVNLEKDVSSQPPTETNLEDKSWVTDVLTSDANTRKGLRYAFVNTDVDSVAQAVRDTGGTIIRVNGQNNGTWLSPVPIAPKDNSNLWSHFLFCNGAFMRDGKKVIRVHNSWGNDTGDAGYQFISEDYFNSGNVKEAGVIYEPVPGMTPPQTTQKIALLQQLISLYYKLLDLLQGTAGGNKPSKKPMTKKILNAAVVIAVIYLGWTSHQLQTKVNNLTNAEIASQQAINLTANFVDKASQGQFTQYINSTQNPQK